MWPNNQWLLRVKIEGKQINSESEGYIDLHTHPQTCSNTTDRSDGGQTHWVVLADSLIE